MKFKLFLGAVFAVALSALVVDASAQTRLATLSDYLHAALKNNPLVGSASQASASAEYNSKAVRKGYYPQIGVGSHLIVAPGYDPAVTNGGEFGAQVSGSYTIYDGGSRGLEISKGNVGVEQGTLNQSVVKADIIYSVSTAFVSAVREDRELDVARQNYEQLKDYLQLVNQLHASGQGSETDVLKTTVDLNNARIDINARKVAIQNSLQALAQASGLPTSFVTGVDTSAISIPYDTTFDVVTNIDLQTKDLVFRQAILDARLAESKLRPTVSLVGDAGALTSLPNIRPGLPDVFGASVGIAVSVPVFTFGSLQDSYLAAEANAKSISMHNDYDRLSLEREFDVTRNDIERAESEIMSLQSNLVVAQQSYLLSKARYAGGSGLSLEVLDAIQAVNQIRLAIEEARAQMQMSILKLNRLNYSEEK